MDYGQKSKMWKSFIYPQEEKETSLEPVVVSTLCVCDLLVYEYFQLCVIMK